MGVREDFVDEWAALGTCWGISRSMAQIHGSLLLAGEPMPADQLQADLGISRGNVSTNLRDLQEWGLIRAVVRRGDRRQFFEAEKDPWRIFCIVARERKRREIEPTLRALQDLEARTESATSKEERAMHKQISSLAKYVSMADDFLDRFASRKESQVIPMMLKLFK